MLPRSIAVLRGGLSGLSATFHLARRLPSVPITLLEKSDRLGGWVRSERVNVRDSNGNTASVLLESGPRTLRPNGKSVLELINLLGLHGRVITVPKSAAAAKHRFLHIPGTQGLTALPHSLLSVFTSPIRQTLLSGALGEPFRAFTKRRQPRTNGAFNDMSFDAFLAYHFGEDFARILGSSLAHGVYAADSRVLSTRAAFPSLWSMTGEDGRGSLAEYVLKGLFGLQRPEFVPTSAGNYELGVVETMMEHASVFSFSDGIESLMGALEEDLKKRTNVELSKSHTITRFSKHQPSGNFTLTDTAGETRSFSHVVSAMPLASFDRLLQSSSNFDLEGHQPPPRLPHLTSNPSSSVTVVNLIFPPTDQPFHPDGFGYLVPRRDNSSDPSFVDYGSLPLEDRLIGVVFDSCALSAQDIYPDDNQAKFTKLTLMLKGVSSDVPQEKDLLNLLSKHLLPKSPIPAPVFVWVHSHSNCIPIPSVGHVERMSELQKALAGDFWDGRFAVLGAGVGGVSVPDCVEQGRIVASRWSQ